MTATREAYVRAVVKSDGLELIAGLEWRAGDNLELIRGRLRAVMRAVANLRPGDHMAIAEMVERMLREDWPDRAYFLEVGNEDADDEGWVQVFQPFGLPRCA